MSGYDLMVSLETLSGGGGRAVTASLLELSSFCRELTGNAIPIASEPSDRAVHIHSTEAATGKCRKRRDTVPNGRGQLPGGGLPVVFRASDRAGAGPGVVRIGLAVVHVPVLDIIFCAVVTVPALSWNANQTQLPRSECLTQ